MSLHETVNTLQCRLNAALCQLNEFRTGEKYIYLKNANLQQLAVKDREVCTAKAEVANANARLVTNNRNWMQVFEDVIKECAKKVKQLVQSLAKMEQRALRAEKQRDDEMDKNRELLSELYAVKVELEKEKEKRSRLVMQLNRNHENSSIPSSQQPNRKKIANSREKSGLKQGAQPGHKGHGRKRQEPTKTLVLTAPEYENNPEYKPTGDIVTKQLINIKVSLDVFEAHAKEYRHKKSGTRVHAKFPDGMVNDVNYGGSVKSLAFLLNNDCFVSIDKTRGLIRELTGGKLEISKGMINGLAEEFTKKTLNEQTAIFSELLGADILGVDFTTAKVNGKQVQVLVCAGGDSHMFYAKERKGHAGVKDTPVEHTQGILVHDHDKTFYSYGKLHQECLVHILRYLVSSMQNEQDRTWNKLMWELIREMIHYRNAQNPEEDADTTMAKVYESKYMEILSRAEKEYEDIPPSDYFRDGFNLQKRLREYKDSHLLFLYDSRVPANNNLCERLLRQLKRKLKQAMTFRSFESLEYFCTTLGLLGMLRKDGDNLFESVAQKFR